MPCSSEESEMMMNRTYLIWHSEYPNSHLLNRWVCSSWILDILKNLDKKCPLSPLLVDRNNEVCDTESLVVSRFLCQQRQETQVKVPKPRWQKVSLRSIGREPQITTLIIHFYQGSLSSTPKIPENQDWIPGQQPVNGNSSSPASGAVAGA